MASLNSTIDAPPASLLLLKSNGSRDASSGQLIGPIAAEETGTEESCLEELPYTELPGANSTGRRNAEVVSIRDENATAVHLLEGNELMEYLFEIGFHRDVMDEDCYDKLKEHGYWERLGFFQKFCLCRLLCIPPHAAHELDEVDKERVAVARKAKVMNKKYQVKEKLPLIYGITAANVLLLVIGFVGNSLVLITVAKFMRKPSVTYIFLCSIASSDLLVNVVCLPMQIYRNLSIASPNINFCRAVNFLFYLSLGCSVFSLLAMSMERYLVICHPMKAQVISTTKRAKKIVIVVWLMSAIVAIPFVYFTRSFNKCVIVIQSGVPLYLFGALSVAALYLIPILIMLYAYISVSISLWRSISMSESLQSKKSDGDDGNKKAKETLERISVIKMLILVLVMFILCWTPYWWYYSLLSFGVLDKTLTSRRPLYEKIILEYSVLVVATANSSLNPVLYAFTSRPFRRGCKDCFLTCFGMSSKRTAKEVSSKMTASTGVSASGASSSATA